MDRIRSARQLSSSKMYLDELIKVMKTAKPFFLSWILMSIARAFQHTPVELSFIIEFQLNILS
jgi:hypothetical protein